MNYRLRSVLDPGGYSKFFIATRDSESNSTRFLQFFGDVLQPELFQPGPGWNPGLYVPAAECVISVLKGAPPLFVERLGKTHREVVVDLIIIPVTVLSQYHDGPAQVKDSLTGSPKLIRIHLEPGNQREELAFKDPEIHIRRMKVLAGNARELADDE